MITGMKNLLFLLILMMTLPKLAYSQQDTISSSGLLDELLLLDNSEVSLLPDKFMPTQRIFWGEKGLMRNFSRFELTPENRERELKLRRTMLTTHQFLGFVTLGGMVAQGVVGSKLYDRDYDLLQLHKTLATGINITYFSTAGLSLFAPPKMLDERKGISTIKIHKALAVVHFSGMIATNILANSIYSNPDLRSLHRAVAFTTFGAYAASMVVIKF
jgi:hypothetical protein